MNEEEIQKRKKSKKEEGTGEQWYFLSFRNPTTNHNLGCCNVAVEGGLQQALAKVRSLGINPGGEVMAYTIDGPELEPDKLYSREEMIAKDYEMICGDESKG